jgi:hypothetical protein
VPDAGLRDVRTAWFKLEMALESLLAASSPKPGDADRIRFAFPIAVVAGQKQPEAARSAWAA